MKESEKNEMNEQEEIKEFAEKIASFFLVFDGLFLFEENAEKHLRELEASLKEKVLHNESCLPVILAMGGDYDSGIDRAKIESAQALLNLLKARKKLQKATEEQANKKSAKKDILAELFGIT